MVKFAILFVTKKKAILYFDCQGLFSFFYLAASLNSDDSQFLHERDYAENAIKRTFVLTLFSTNINKGVFIICGRGAATMTGVGW